MPPSSVGDLSLELLRLSLSQRQAKRRLIDGVAERLQLERRPLILGELLFRLLEPDTAAAAALGVLLLVVAVTGLALPWDGLLGGLLLALAVANAWISSRESRLAAGELKSRLQVWLRLISRDHHIHRAAADGPATVALMRDGVWLRLHRNLCVEGDLIKLSAGEEAPGACAQRPHLTSLCGLEAQALEAGAPFFPAPLPPLPRGICPPRSTTRQAPAPAPTLNQHSRRLQLADRRRALLLCPLRDDRRAADRRSDAFAPEAAAAAAGPARRGADFFFARQSCLVDCRFSSRARGG